MKRQMTQAIDYNDFININLNRATRKLQRIVVRDILQDEGFTVQEWRALLNLAKFGPCHLRELARLACFDPSPLGKAVVMMEERKLVKRVDDDHDARRKQISITTEGREIVDRIWPQMVNLSGHVKKQIGKTRYNALKDALEAILRMEDPADKTPLAENVE